MKYARHLVIPDTQVRRGVPTDHLTHIGRYIVDKQPDVVIHLGDHWDLPSLSTYANAMEREGQDVVDDIKAGNEALEKLMAPYWDYQKRCRKAKKKPWKPRFVMLRGNHEHRLARTVGEQPRFRSMLGDHDFNDKALGWEVYEFLVPATIHGVTYCHYFYAPMTGKPYGGTAHSKLKNIGHTFTMGHVQGLDVATRILPNGTQQWGLVAGSCYLHDETYKGPQANHHWRGIVMKNEVAGGRYDPMFVSLDYLKRKYG